MDRPSPQTLVLIKTDPTKSHRAVEALRIALGLGSHNEGQTLTLILRGQAPFLLAEDTSDIVDADILEKHLPVFIEWGIPFAVVTDSDTPSQYVSDCITKPITPAEITAALESADRVLIF
jgi:sulfur relay (sulfurtransferase) DsrF/TusC family protein